MFGWLFGDQYGFVLFLEQELDWIVELVDVLCKIVWVLIIFSDCEIFLICFVGIVFFEGGKQGVEDMFINVEIVFNYVKWLGGDWQEVFCLILCLFGKNIVDLELDLWDVIKKEIFGVFFQLIIWLEDQIVVGFEVLVCWNYFKCGNVLLVEFILMVEQLGLINEFGMYMFDKGVMQLVFW